jgi:hypothetical protein
MPDLNTAQIKQAIEKAIPIRGWLIKSQAEGKFEVFYVKATTKESYTLSATISYDATSVQVSYKDSQNLDYEKSSDGTETVHRAVNSWLGNLSMDIKSQLVILSVTHK